MNTKEKALEIYGFYQGISKKYKTGRPLFSEREQAKASAIYCINQILECDHDEHIWYGKFTAEEYWENVKNEIFKL